MSETRSAPLARHDAALARAAEQEGLRATSGAQPVSVVEWVLYLLLGTFLGIVFVKSEVISWYRIQEMFRFQSVHMYGVIASAVAVAAVSVRVIRGARVRTLKGEAIQLRPKQWTRGLRRYWLGGFVFGLGWALLGACPGPIFTLMGAGETVFIVPLAAAVAGTMAYGALFDRLPH